MERILSIIGWSIFLVLAIFGSLFTMKVISDIVELLIPA